MWDSYGWKSSYTVKTKEFDIAGVSTLVTGPRWERHYYNLALYAALNDPNHDSNNMLFTIVEGWLLNYL